MQVTTARPRAARPVSWEPAKVLANVALAASRSSNAPVMTLMFPYGDFIGLSGGYQYAEDRTITGYLE
ncbi:hypothetical protein GCM10009556_017200 [Acrocarpospora pleiomorpha]